MTTKHTPAPWVVSLHGNYIENDSKFKIARVTGRENSPNAKLISASPDLLDALIDAFELIAGDSNVSHFDTVDKMRTAIAKATQ
jgi:hypothetical protein